MPDWFLIFAPVLLIPIVALLRFVGCNQVFGLDETVVLAGDTLAVNCGGPQSVEEGVTFEKDDSAQGTDSTYFDSEGGAPFKLLNAQVTDTNGNPSPAIYGTARVGDNIKYTFEGLRSGGFLVTLKFAEIGSAQNPGDRVFAIGINGQPDGGNPIDIVARAGGPLVAFDLDLPAQSFDNARTIVVELQGLSATEALVNAILLQKRNLVTLSPSQLVILSGATQQFTATTNFDSNAQLTWDLDHGVPSGQVSTTGLYIAPAGILSPTQETVLVDAQSGVDHAEGQASVAIYLPIDTITKGAWRSKYGTEGYVLANSPPDIQLPPYVTQFDIRLSDGTPLNVTNLGIPANDPRVLVNPDGSPRPALVWNDLNGAHGITISFRFTDNDPHLFGVYCLDNGPDRRQRFTVTQLDSGVTETVDSAIGTGTYLFWIGNGRIQIDVTKVPGSTGINNVISALFFR